MKRYRGLHVHPFFFSRLVQKWRHGELREAAAIMAHELRIAAREARARNKDEGRDDPFNGDGGLLLLPTLKRQQELGLFLPETNLAPQEHEHGTDGSFRPEW